MKKFLLFAMLACSAKAQFPSTYRITDYMRYALTNYTLQEAQNYFGISNSGGTTVTNVYITNLFTTNIFTTNISYLNGTNTYLAGYTTNDSIVSTNFIGNGRNITNVSTTNLVGQFNSTNIFGLWNLTNTFGQLNASNAIFGNWNLTNTFGKINVTNTFCTGTATITFASALLSASSIRGNDCDFEFSITTSAATQQANSNYLTITFSTVAPTGIVLGLAESGTNSTAAAAYNRWTIYGDSPTVAKVYSVSSAPGVSTTWTFACHVGRY